MSKKQLSPMQQVLEYHEQYGHIPTDYMERLAYLYEEIGFKQSDLTELLNKLDALTKVEWSQIMYVFYMEPKPAARPRQVRLKDGKTFHFYVPGAKLTKDVFDNFKEMHSDMECVISTPSIFHTSVYTKMPSNMTKQEKIAAELGVVHNVNEPDWDNFGKQYSDMVQETLVSNDSIVYRGSVEKFYSILPRVEVLVKFMREYDCKYNKRSIEKRKSFQNNDRTIKDLGYII